MAAGIELLTASQDGGSLTHTADLLDGLQAGAVGVWRWNADTGALHWSDNMEAIHRLPAGSFDGTFQSFLNDIHPDDRQAVLAEVEKCLATGGHYAAQYRQAPGASGSVHWIEARGRVVRDGDGRATGMTGISQEITAHKAAQHELGLRARQQEAVAHLGEQALAGATQDAIFAEAVRMVAELVEADCAEILELSSDRETLLQRAAFGWRDGSAAGEPAATSAPDTQIGLTLRSKEPVVVSDYASEDRFARPARLAEQRIASAGSIAIPGGEGGPFGAIAVYCRRVRCIAKTDLRFLQSIAHALGTAIRARQDQERSELLIGELRHRVGNLFSLVQALHRQTGQSAVDARDLEMKFSARLAALASSHSLILDGGWQRTSVRALLEKTLSPYSERVEFSGADVRMPADAAFSFSMALHELATNASKYGALREPDGRLHIDCRAEPDSLGEKLVLVWKEKASAPRSEADQDGFGSRLISQVVERQLGGSMTRVMEPDGLRITIVFPVG